jgi:hypothetical protein
VQINAKLTNAYKEKRQIEICQRSPGEHKLYGVIYEFYLYQSTEKLNKKNNRWKSNLKEQLPKETLTRSPYPEEKESSMDGCKQRSVQPTPTL